MLIMQKSVERLLQTTWHRFRVTNNIYVIRKSCRHCHGLAQIQNTKESSRYDATKQVNDYQRNKAQKLQSQRLNKYRTSYRIGGKRNIIGTENVKQKLPSHLMLTYESMMHSLHCRNWEEAVSTLHCITESDPTAHHLVLYTVAIRTCAVCGQMDEATKLYHQMVYDHGIKPDEVTLIAMLKGCSVQRDWNLSQFWSNKVIEDGQLDADIALNVAAYSLMISSANEMTWGNAWSLFQSLRNKSNSKNHKNVELDMIAINSMLDTLARAKQSSLCQQLFTEIQDDPKWRVLMNGRTFEAVIRSCVHNGDLSAAMNYVKLMQSEEFNFKATKQMISALLQTVKSYQGEEDVFGLAVALWNQVIGPKPKPIYPDAVLFGIMIDLCSTYKDLAFALKLFREMVTVYNVQPTVIVFNNILKCAVSTSAEGAQSNDDTKTLEWYLSMINDMRSVYGIEPDQFTFNIVLKAVIQSIWGRLNEKENVLDKNEKYKVITELLTFWSTEMEIKNEVSYSTMIHALSSIKLEHFGDEKDILYRQLMALYESACDEGYLGHWSKNEEGNMSVSAKRSWKLEMHGWSVQIASVAMQYFCDRELPAIHMKEGAVIKDLEIVVGKGIHSDDHAKIRDHLLRLLRDSMNLTQAKICEDNSGCLFVPRSDLLRYLQTTRLSEHLD